MPSPLHRGSSSRRRDLPLAARLGRVEVEALHIDLRLSGLQRSIGNPAAIGRELTLIGVEVNGHIGHGLAVAGHRQHVKMVGRPVVIDKVFAVPRPVFDVLRRPFLSQQQLLLA